MAQINEYWTKLEIVQSTPRKRNAFSWNPHLNVLSTRILRNELQKSIIHKAICDSQSAALIVRTSILYVHF